VFENRMLRRKSGPEREEVAGGLRRLHSEELHNLYTSPNIIRMIRDDMSGIIARIVYIIKAYSISVGKPEGKRPLGRRRHRWEYNIRMSFDERGWVNVDRMHLAQDRVQRRGLVNTLMNLRFP
jgi:hypothetical protein